MIGGVSKKDTPSRASGKLMRGCGGEVGVTGAPKHAEMLVRGRGSEEGEVGGGSTDGLRGKAVQEVGGGVKSLSPVAGWKGSLEQQGAHHIVGGADHALGLAVLGGSVGT